MELNRKIHPWWGMGRWNIRVVACGGGMGEGCLVEHKLSLIYEVIMAFSLQMLWYPHINTVGVVLGGVTPDDFLNKRSVQCISKLPTVACEATIRVLPVWQSR
jgi:hypothetical protein